MRKIGLETFLTEDEEAAQLLKLIGKNIDEVLSSDNVGLYPAYGGLELIELTVNSKKNAYRVNNIEFEIEYDIFVFMVALLNFLGDKKISFFMIDDTIYHGKTSIEDMRYIIKIKDYIALVFDYIEGCNSFVLKKIQIMEIFRPNKYNYYRTSQPFSSLSGW